MFLDWYIRFRRIDEWPETAGKVPYTVLEPGMDGGEGKSPDHRKVYFEYSSNDGCSHQGMARAVDGTEVFYLDAGDAIKLRYHPQRTDKNFVHGAFHDSEIWTFVGFAAVAVLTLVLIGFFTGK
jgi:hypothetical protein